MTVDAHYLDELEEAIFGAVLAADSWPSVLDRLSRAFGALGGFMFALPGGG